MNITHNELPGLKILYQKLDIILLRYAGQVLKKWSTKMEIGDYKESLFSILCVALHYTTVREYTNTRDALHT